MAARRPISLRTRLIRTMVAAAVVAFIVVALAALFYERVTVESRVADDLRQQAESLGIVLEPAIEFSDWDTAARYLESRRSFVDVIAVGLYSQDGERVAQFVRDPSDHIVWPATPRVGGEERVGDTMHGWSAIRRDGRLLGYLFVCVDMPTLLSRLPEYGVMSAAVLLAMLAMSALLAGGLRRHMLNPLEELVGATQRVSEHKEIAQSVPVSDTDELGKLANALNEMLATVAARDHALRGSEQRLRSIVDNEPECVKVVGRDGVLQEINPAGLRLLEAESLQVANQYGLLKFIAEAHREEFRTLMRRVFHGDGGAIEYETIGLRGGRHWLEARVVPMRDAQGNVTAMLAISRDVTERMRHEQIQQRRSEQQAAIVKLGIDALSVQAFDTFLQHAMDELARMLGADYSVILELCPDRTKAKVVASHGWDRWYPGREWRVEPQTPTEYLLENDAPLLVNDFATDQRFCERVRNHRSDFRSCIGARIRGTGAPWGIVAVHSNQANAFTTEDINALEEVANMLAQAVQRMSAENAQRLVEAQLLQSQKMEALGRLAGGIAHDFNNLLSAILGNVQLAKQDVGEGHAALVSLEEIRQAGQRSKALVQRILAFSRHQEPRKEYLRLQAIVEEVGRLLRATIPAQVEIVMSVDPDVPATMVDGAQVHQCILNLATNAWQAIGNEPGRIALSLRSYVVTEANNPLHLPLGSYACIEVEDSGVGMDAATREHIFEPFFTTKPVGEGTGLGLSVVHGIMQSHGGGVDVRTARNQGSTFYLYFPLVSASGDVVAPNADQAIAATGNGKGHVLYIDDEEPLVFLATRLLERMGLRVSGFTRVRDALAAFRMAPGEYDLVITDLSMPEMSGMDLARQILEIRPSARVVLASGYVRQTDVEAAKNIGVREVLLKPNTVDELGPIVLRLLAQD